MAIWIWIIAAWVLSYLALGKKKVSFEHLIWILLPVDMYGISVAGATIKPYMIFCVLLFVRLLLMRREKLFLNSWIYISGFICAAVVLVNLMNNRTSSAPKAALLLLIVWGCVVLYLLNCGKSTVIDVPNVMVATGIGYGIIFIIGFILMNTGLDIPGVLADNRYADGFFMPTSNVRDDILLYFHRLRGFTIDPNTMIGTFAFCSTCCIMRIIKGAGNLREWLGLIISGVCVLLSNSRMGILCFIILAVITFVISYRFANTYAKNAIKLTILILVGLIAVMLLCTDIIQDIIARILENYSNRSGLNDKYGRFSIWKTSISVLINQTPWIGTGLGQMRHYSDLGKDCHNTWLAMVCDNGIIVGGALVSLFLYALFVGSKKNKINTEDANSNLLWSVFIGTLVVMISLISVDNLTYSYLWFGASMLCENHYLVHKGRKVWMQAR